MAKKPTEEENVATALQRWPTLRVERLVAFRRHLAAARAAAHADAEGFGPLAIAVEEIGAACLGRAESLGTYREPLKKCLCLDDDGRREFDDLFKTVTKGRNSGMHEGAWVRHVATNGVELAIVIEDALARYIMEQEQKQANGSEPVWRIKHFMISDPICAESWQTVGHVRRVMLRSSFSFLPLWDERVQAWRLIGDHALADWLGAHGEARKKREQRSLDEALDNEPRLPSPVLAATLDLGATREDALAATKAGPALVVEPQHKERLLGIITAFDLL